MTSRNRNRTAPILFAVLVGLALAASGRLARASFDVVGVYHEKVKSFESVYYLKADETWRRDRRIIESFFQLDHLLDSRASYSGGVIFNHRHQLSNVQMGFFAIYNTTSSLAGDGEPHRWELLFGGRQSFDEYLELTVGGYWREGPAEPKHGSIFFELNSPEIFAKSSYVFGLGEGPSVPRWDLRFDYDQLSWVDSLQAGLVRYEFVEERWFLAADIDRIGHPAFQFFTFRLRVSPDDGFAWLQGGLDILLRSDADFNYKRRGHFGTSMRLSALYSLVSPETANFLGYNLSPGASEDLHGFRGNLQLQFPAKWLGTALGVLGMAAAAHYAKTAHERKQAQELGAKLLTHTIDKPEDIVFCRINLTYSYNDPDNYAVGVPPQADVHRIFFSIGFIY